MDEQISAAVVIAGAGEVANRREPSCCVGAAGEVTGLYSCVQWKRTGGAWDVETALQLVRDSTGLSVKLGTSLASGK